MSESTVGDVIKTEFKYIEKEFAKINHTLEKLDDIVVINERLKIFESHIRNHHSIVVRSIKEYQRTPEWRLEIDNHVVTSKEIDTYVNKLINNNSNLKKVLGYDNIKKEGITRISVIIGSLLTSLITAIVTYILTDAKQ